MKIPVYYLDAFTDKIFSGNQIAVCPLEFEISTELMQKISSEINFSETAFVWNDSFNYQDSGNFNLKWFTPTDEVNLCGHGTLGTASLLFQYFKNKNTEISFNTLSGNLKAKIENDKVWLDMPKYDFEPIKVSDHLLKALRINDYKNSVLSKSSQIILIEVDHIKRRDPNFQALCEIKNKYLGAVILTCRANNNYDFISRYFTPWYGINEDSVTGSAHCLLANYWSKILNKNEMIAYQDSKRGGEVFIKLNDNFNDRVFIGGKSILTLKGELFISA